MNRLLSISLFTTLVFCGCSHDKKFSSAPIAPQSTVNLKPTKNPLPDAKPTDKKFKSLKISDSELIVTPETGLIGKVTSVNANARFVVINFPIGKMPAVDSRLNVYRRGLKVGEVKVTGPQRDDNTIADIVSGDAQPKDEVRED